MAGNEEEVKRAGAESSKRAQGHNPGPAGGGGRRNLPFSPYTMALGGLLIAATIGYYTLYANKKHDDTPRSGVAKP